VVFRDVAKDELKDWIKNTEEIEEECDSDDIISGFIFEGSDDVNADDKDCESVGSPDNGSDNFIFDLRNH